MNLDSCNFEVVTSCSFNFSSTTGLPWPYIHCPRHSLVDLVNDNCHNADQHYWGNQPHPHVKSQRRYDVVERRYPGREGTGKRHVFLYVHISYGRQKGMGFVFNVVAHAMSGKVKHNVRKAVPQEHQLKGGKASEIADSLRDLAPHISAEAEQVVDRIRNASWSNLYTRTLHSFKNVYQICLVLLNLF